MYEQEQWAEVIILRQRAVAGAPNEQERANILALMARAYFQMENTIEACHRSRRANTMQPSQEFLAEIEQYYERSQKSEKYINTSLYRENQ